MQKKKEIWMLQTKRADFNGLAMRLGVSPVAVRIMRNRGLLDEREMRKYLYGTLDDLYDPRQMKGMETAAGIIEKKLIEGKKIRIIGDYDIDGVCSTYILLKGFRRAAGNGQIDYEIPDRIRDGYGINESIIRQAAEDGIDTLVTCDNGIAALKEISIAKQLGMTVVVTDHHEVPIDAYGQILPPADAVVDPKQDGETYPYHEICGAVVAWKLINVIYEDLGIPEHEWMELLEFAAIATVGDVMKLQDENRLIVKYGLKKIGSTKNTGLRMLVEKNNLDINNLSAYHIGFVIGPCLNAGGRLKSAKVALRMLLEQDPDRVSGLADELKELNDVRKDMAAHSIRTTEHDVEILAKHGASVAHCIASNTKAAKGVAPVSLMHKHGMSVGFGTDGPASGNTLDLFIQMRMCENFHKNELHDRSAFPAKEVVSMATIEGARALGLGDITGSIEPGKQADLVLVETDSPNMFPVYDPYSALVYSAIASNVRDVYVAGECLVKEKKLVREDFAKIRNDLREKMERTAFKDMKNLV